MKKNILFLSILTYTNLFANSTLVDFNEHAIGKYTSEMAFKDFQRDLNKPHPQNAEIIKIDNNNNALRLRYPKNCLGTSKEKGCASQFHLYTKKNYSELWLSYDLFFEENFDFKKGGKLPGFCGGKCYTGGKSPAKGDGWSARIMWREKGQAEQYIYHVNQKEKYGDSFLWKKKEEPFFFKTNQWYNIITKITLNNVTNDSIYNNAKIQSWVNKEQVLQIDSLILRTSDSIFIDQIYISTFHGGGTNSWSPRWDSYAIFDNFIFSTNPLINTSK